MKRVLKSHRPWKLIDTNVNKNNFAGSLMNAILQTMGIAIIMRL
jgi:hypothetical protein